MDSPGDAFPRSELERIGQTIHICLYVLHIYLMNIILNSCFSFFFFAQILKAPRKSARFPDPEQQENVVQEIVGFKYST